MRKLTKYALALILVLGENIVVNAQLAQLSRFKGIYKNYSEKLALICKNVPIISCTMIEIETRKELFTIGDTKNNLYHSSGAQCINKTIDEYDLTLCANGYIVDVRIEDLIEKKNIMVERFEKDNRQ